ncbi:3-hydroxyacyl-CoA dehydrogenase [Amycolatopsis thailandensis]|uniref:3-hydroxyacyl-CoA dehydrogenase n=1 Tax=Amycolatopsis thailandensis TaxID=589330 RepID=A0A229SIB4_9PSEU|nr:3-hydroxyacyl-CoA dehydrogenase family protein [Amycolatopsis thailandensis]OXM58509.1 3-hydroxyacyl-CoA dehydrogenase [Amycolatopsis thailandensis]
MSSEKTDLSTGPADVVAIVGGGSMGAGIAALFTGFGKPVIVVESNKERRESLPGRVGRSMKHGRLLGGLPKANAAGELTVTSDFSAIASTAVVVEAVTEDFETKRAVYAEAGPIVAAGTVFVSCTSSFRIAGLAELCPRAEDLIGVHFMNPAYLIRTVEAVRGQATSERVVRKVGSLLAEVGRTPVFVGDGVGFVTSRLLHQMINDAARIVEEGLADAESVDRLVEAALGHPMGPLRTADLIGIDNLVDSIKAQAAQDGAKFPGPCRLLSEMAASGRVGRKAGRGFYRYGEP